MKASGLLDNHSYGLLVVVTVQDAEAKKDVVLLKLRNPLAEFEWNGKWSDKSNLWTPELKKELDYEDSKDGSFFMEFREA